LDELVDTVPDWWSRLERLPRTLIHNDFNPRNLAFRRSRRSRRSRREEAGGLRLCAYDWELACLGLPQRDLAELLCFVLPPSAAAESAPYYLELHRQALQQSSGRTIDRDQWRDGFGIALRDLMLQRLPLYALVHTFRPQRFLERVVRTWQALFTIK
jgi:thiamine kinase-like enzyme